MVADPHRLLERVNPGHERGCHLADAVSDDRRGPHAMRLPEPRERELERKVRRLRDLGARHARLRLGREHRLLQRPAGERLKDRVDLVERGGDDRLVLDEFAPHRPPLRAHAGIDEDERQAARGNAGAGNEPLVRLAGRERDPLLAQFLEAPGDRDGAMREMTAAKRGRMGVIVERAQRALAELECVFSRKVAQSLRASRGQRNHARHGRGVTRAARFEARIRG